MKRLACAVLLALPMISSAAIPFEKYQLANGLRVVLIRDTTAPVVAIDVLYAVGSRTEEKGRLGFAHLFEHLMFEGSAHVKKGEHRGFILAGGGEVNGSTHQDYTEFIETLPSNRLALVLWLEADRMGGLTVTDETLKAQKEAIEKERAATYAQPFRAAIDGWSAFAFGNPHNANPVLSPAADDVANASLDDAMQFYRTYYAPNNAVLTISGDFDSAEAKKLVTSYFGSLSPQPQPKRADLTEAPRGKGKTILVKDANARVPAVIFGWPAPPRHSPDWYAIDMLDALMTSGENARLKQRMVKVNESLLQADANLGWPVATPLDYKDPADYAMILIHKPNYSAEEMLAQYRSELDKLIRDGVGLIELERVRAVVRFAQATRMQTALNRAQLLGLSELLDGDPGSAEKSFSALMSVTSEQIQAAVKKYLTAERVDVMAVEPAPPKAGAKQ